MKSNEFICGPSIEAANSEAAIAKIEPIYNFAVQVVTADTIVCTPRASVSISITVSLVLISIALFSVLGVIAGRHSATKVEKK